MSVFTNQMNRNNEILDQLEETCIDMLDSLGMLNELRREDIEALGGKEGVKMARAAANQILDKATSSKVGRAIYNDRALSRSFTNSVRDDNNGRTERIINKSGKVMHTDPRYTKAAVVGTRLGTAAIGSRLAQRGVDTQALAQKGREKAGAHNASYYDDSYSQADFIREACYTILATLDELE